MLTDKQWQRLPKYVRDHIARVENKLERKEEQLRAITSGDSPIWWTMPLEDEKHGIPVRASVVFQLDGGSIQISVRAGKLLAGTYSGRHSIGSASTGASNQIELFLRNY